MGGLLAGLASLAAPITARILIALGFSVITITGVSVAFDSLKSQIVSMVGSAPLEAAMLIGLGGGWQALGIILGAMGFAVSFWGLTAATKIIGVGS